MIDESNKNNISYKGVTFRIYINDKYVIIDKYLNNEFKIIADTGFTYEELMEISKFIKKAMRCDDVLRGEENISSTD